MKRWIGPAITVLLVLSIILGILTLFKTPPPVPAPVMGDLPLSVGFPGGPWEVASPFQEGVGVFSVYGPLMVESEASFPFGAAGTDMMVKRLRRFASNRNVKALVVRINSPGGAVAASQEIYETLREIRGRGIPVVASFGDVAASGGYYIASAADSIVANPGTVTGSIGVIIGSLDLSRLLKRWDIGFNIIKSKEHKDILAYWREMTPEERRLLQNTVDRVYRQFLTVVSAGRRMPVSQVEKLADGSILSGEEALKVGLVDRLGTLNDAVKLAGELAGLRGEPYVIQEHATPVDFLSMMFSAAVRLPHGLSDAIPMSLPVSYRYDPSGGMWSAAEFARLASALSYVEAE